MGYNAVIVDDESHAITTLQRSLQKHAPEVQVLGEANSVSEASALIAKLQPELVFLDIDLGAESGFDLLDKHPNPKFSVIFVTAFSSFALKAFRYAALDYLVKPVVSDNLKEAIARLGESPLMAPQQQRLNAVREAVESQELKVITLSTLEAYIPVEVAQITMCHSSGNYTDLHLANGRKETVCKPIREFEELLPNDVFVRVHQSYIINLRFLDRYIKRDGFIVMKDKTEIVLARRRKEQFLQALQLKS